MLTYTAREAAEELGVRKSRVFQLIHAKQLVAEMMPAQHGGKAYWLITAASVHAYKERVGGRWAAKRHTPNK